MGRIIVRARDGKRYAVRGIEGRQVMLVLRLAGDLVEGACGGVMSCGTCHVHVDEAWRDRIPPASEAEQALLDMLIGANAASRLSCQIEYTEALDGLELTLAPME